MSLDARMQAIWYGRRGVSWLLLVPFSWLFYTAVALRRWAFRVGLLRSVQLSRPVIVVGNLTVGGTGKTPLVIWLSKRLAQQGFKVGIVTRGYGGTAKSWPQAVQADSDPTEVGDEAVLIAQQTEALVFAGPDRVSDARQAIAAGAEIVICDDGLQHYRLRRDCEWLVLDSSRMLGNGSLLPAGPLREPIERLKEAGLILLNRRIGRAVPPPPGVSMMEYGMGLTGLRSLHSGEHAALSKLRGQQVHVVTGIGNPQSFVDALRLHGLNVSARVLPDHASFTASDVDFGDALPVLMTAKDAVKCRDFTNPSRAPQSGQYWVVEAEVVMEEAVAAQLLSIIKQTIALRASH